MGWLCCRRMRCRNKLASCFNIAGFLLGLTLLISLITIVILKKNQGYAITQAERFNCGNTTCLALGFAVCGSFSSNKTFDFNCYPCRIFAETCGTPDQITGCTEYCDGHLSILWEYATVCLTVLYLLGIFKLKGRVLWSSKNVTEVEFESKQGLKTITAEHHFSANSSFVSVNIGDRGSFCSEYATDEMVDRDNDKIETSSSDGSAFVCVSAGDGVSIRKSPSSRGSDVCSLSSSDGAKSATSDEPDFVTADESDTDSLKSVDSENDGFTCRSLLGEIGESACMPF